MSDASLKLITVNSCNFDFNYAAYHERINTKRVASSGELWTKMRFREGAAISRRVQALKNTERWAISLIATGVLLFVVTRLTWSVQCASFEELSSRGLVPL